MMILKNLRIWSREGFAEDCYLAVEGSRIHAIGPMSECPMDGESLDCRGYTAYPGFIDAHSHLGMFDDSIGAEGEENQGLCTGSENFWCVNNTSSDEDIQATLDFLNWCVTSDEGTSAMADDMGFVIPFKAAKDSTNPLIAIANDYVAEGKTSVDWCFSTMPSEEWKNGVGSALTAYAAGTGSWDDVVTAFVDGWAKEYKLANG